MTAAAPSQVLFLVQIAVLILGGRLLGEAMQRLGQPSVIGALLTGLLLGPSALGALWPEAQQALFPPVPAQKAMLDGVAQIGVLLLLVLAGMETDVKLMRKSGAAAVWVSVTGVCIPFVCGFALGQYLPESLLPRPDARLVVSLILGTALSISSVKIVAMVVREMDFLRRNVGQVILASAVIDDTIGWIIIAVTFGIASQGALDVWSVAYSIGGVALFMAVSFTVGRPAVFALIRWTNDTFVSEVPVVSMILVIMAVMALITYEIGVHTVLGAFVAGILIGQSPMLTSEIDAQLRGLVTALFAPVFFGLAGLSADLTVLGNREILGMTIVLVAIATIGKFGGAFVGGTVGGMSVRESIALGCGMNARGSTEVIVASIALSMGMLTENLFSMIVTMAVLTTMVMPPMLRGALARLPMREDERERLAREEREERGFLAKAERVLLVADDSGNGRFAAHLMGLVVGSRRMPTTVLPVCDKPQPSEQAASHAAEIETVLKTASATAAEVEDEFTDKKTQQVNVITRASDKPAEEAVEDEVDKGYGLMAVGLVDMLDAEGNFAPELNRIAAKFEGPLALLIGRGERLIHPGHGPLSVLVPATGTDASRRAAEVAVAIARANVMPLTALYAESGARDAPRRQAERKESHVQTILKDLVSLAAQSSVAARTAVRSGLAPDEAILRETEAGNFDLIVMGVNRRPGDALYFGEVAARVVRETHASVLLIAS
jgi:Kef-type K+ transport system membrane component KefB/nucleotide-binding universal stress UspA family protein